MLPEQGWGKASRPAFAVVSGTLDVAVIEDVTASFLSGGGAADHSMIIRIQWGRERRRGLGDPLGTEWFTKLGTQSCKVKLQVLQAS